jgi:predicted RNA-binding Zn ribbon-like protein
MSDVDPGPDLALALAGTRLTDPAGERDLLDGPRELERWLAANGIEEPGLALRLADIRALRSAIRNLFEAAAGGRSLPSDAASALNGFSAAAPRYPSLEAGDGPPRAVEIVGASGPAAVFAAIARSAIATLGGPDRERLRICPAPRCGRAFLAERPRQVWCSNACGNRVRVARHHERRRAAGAPGGPSTLPA